MAVEYKYDFIVRKQLNDNELCRDIKGALSEMEKEIKRLYSDTPDQRTGSDVQRILRAGGKRLRPILAYLCAGIGRGEAPIPLMCMLEIMHTVSLIHDDVVDDAATRRGVPTINAVAGNFHAIQCGDFLLSKAMTILKVYRGTGINEILSEIVMEMCRGEFQQQKYLYDTSVQNRELYYLQIKRKTSSLIAASCCTGALAGKLTEKETKLLEKYGNYLGLAFQIQDDILDYRGTTAFGKQAGLDIRNGIYTLPVIILLEKGMSPFWRRLLEKRNKTDSELAEILNYVRASGAIDEAVEEMRLLSGNAVQALTGVRNCPEKRALIQLAEKLAERNI